MEPISKTVPALSTFKRGLFRPTPPDPQKIQAVHELFDALKGQLGAKFADLWAGTETHLVEQEWASALAGFRKHEIERGLNATAHRQFAPTLGEFCVLCRPCLNAEHAYWEAAACLMQRDQGELGDWTHPAVFFAACEMSTEVRGGDWRRHRTRWTRLLAAELDKGWREIPKPAMRVEYEAKPAKPSAAVQAHIDRLKREARMSAAQRDEATRKVDYE
jgi:hypothetical protein